MKPLPRPFTILGLILLFFHWNIDCSEAQQSEEKQPPELDIAAIEQVTGMKGTECKGEYKLTVPHNDLDVTVDGFTIIPSMGMGSWAAWQGTPDNASVAGDFVMLAYEVEPVIEALVQNRIEVITLHNHMIHEEPRMFFLHYWGTGPTEALTQGLREALNQIGAAPGKVWNFEDIPEGSFPAGWKAETTNPDRTEGTWEVIADPTAPSGSKVLKLSDTGASSGGTYNIAWTGQVSFANGTIEVKVKAGTGREDQGGGPIWRVQNKNNYYIARWNPLEDNFRLYYVKDGDRVQIASADADLSTDQWHTIKIEQEGSKIEGYLDGEKNSRLITRPWFRLVESGFGQKPMRLPLLMIW
ncbi:MAG TPA: DUF1259 domain-containing protein [bacterium]|nr:DUF1259 domain-containing protein [bacterium]